MKACSSSEKLGNARNDSGIIGNYRECSHEVVIEGDEDIVIKHENVRFFVYRKMTDLSPGKNPYPGIRVPGFDGFQQISTGSSLDTFYTTVI